MKNEASKLLIKNTVSLYLMNIAKLVFPIMTLPFLTRVLTTESYGIVVYTKAITVYVQLVIDFGFMLSATKNIVLAEGDKNRIGYITGNTIIEKIFLSLIAIVIYIISCFYIPILRENILFSILFLIATLLNVFIFDFMFRGLEKMHLVAIPYVLAKLTTTILTFALIRSNADINLIPSFEILGNILAALVSYIFVIKLGIKIRISSYKVWIADIKESFVYFVSNFATTFFGVLTTVIAGFYLSKSNIAFWGIAMQLLSAAKALYNPVCNSLYPHMIKTKDIYYIKKINKYMAIPMLIGMLIVILYSEFVMKIIGGDKYAVAGDLLRLLLPAFVCSFYSMLYGWPVLGAIGKVKETTNSTIFASIVQVIGIVVLISTGTFSMFNLAITCSVSELSLLIARYYIYSKNKKLFYYKVGGKL